MSELADRLQQHMATLSSHFGQLYMYNSQPSRPSTLPIEDQLAVLVRIVQEQQDVLQMLTEVLSTAADMLLEPKK